MSGTPYRPLTDDHARLDGLLQCSMTEAGTIKRDAYAEFRAGLLKHKGSARWEGALVGLWSLVLLSYYLVVADWALGYWVSSATGSLTAFAIFTSSFNSVLFFLHFLAICGSAVFFGVRHGIEAVSRLLMPLLFLMLVGLAVDGVSLSGWSSGLRFYLAPHLSSLVDPLVWIIRLWPGFLFDWCGHGGHDYLWFLSCLRRKNCVFFGPDHGR